MFLPSGRACVRRVPRALAFLVFLPATLVLAVTALDSPPSAPTWSSDDPTDPQGGVFVYDAATFTATARFNPVAPRPPEVLGYQLYLGAQPEAPGAPHSLGNTPCDLGGSTSALLQTCLTPAGSIGNASVYVVVTAYNQFGHEGVGSAERVFVPVRPPSDISVSPTGGNSRQMQLGWVPGTAPGNIAVTITSEVFRRPAGSTGAYTKIFAGAAATFTDSGLDRDTTYEYVFRSKATPSGSPISTYSAVTANQIRTATIPPDVFPVFVPGHSGLANPHSVTTMLADEAASVSQVGGILLFDNQDDTTGCIYNVGPTGISQASYDGNAAICYPIDHCDPDPLNTVNHAALLIKIGSAPPQPAFGGGTFTGTGTLVLFVNDCRPANNVGTFFANVIVGKR